MGPFELHALMYDLVCRESSRLAYFPARTFIPLRNCSVGRTHKIGMRTSDMYDEGYKSKDITDLLRPNVHSRFPGKNGKKKCTHCPDA